MYKLHFFPNPPSHSSHPIHPPQLLPDVPAQIYEIILGDPGARKYRAKNNGVLQLCLFRFCLEFGNVVLIEYSQQYVKPSHLEVVASGVDEAGDGRKLSTTRQAHTSRSGRIRRG